MAAFLFIYVTAPSASAAEEMGRALVGEGLAACANILPGMRSIYRWGGQVETADEVVLILKTRAEAYERLAARIKALHPYECPCIVALPIAAGAQDYLDWIAASVPLSPCHPREGGDPGGRETNDGF